MDMPDRIYAGGRTRKLDDAQDYAAFMFKRTFLRAVQ
jgi:hypothetical protein